MVRKFKRPRDKQELEQLETEGLWKAIAFSKKVGESREKITLEAILRIHRVIFEYAIPEIAGRFRADGEDIKKLTFMEPPPGRLVRQRMYEFARELDIRLSEISSTASATTRSKRKGRTESIFDLAAWIQYQITSIHPFCEGNGRMARLMTNLILRRHGFPPSRVKFEGENKKEYLGALGQIDTHNDYEPLEQIIIRSAIESLRKEEKARRNSSA